MTVEQAFEALLAIYGGDSEAFEAYMQLWRAAAERDLAEDRAFSLHPKTALAIIDVLEAVLNR